jgi:hypothetical protein
LLARSAAHSQREGRGKKFGRVAAAGVGARVVQPKIRVNRKVLAYALSTDCEPITVQNVYGKATNAGTTAESNVQMLDYFDIREANHG